MKGKQGKSAWLYFNTQDDNDNIGTTSNVCFRADDIVSMGPTADGVLTIYYKPIINQDASDAAGEILTDRVDINLTTDHTHFALMEVLTHHMNNTRPSFGGFVDVVDDHTIIVGGGAGSRTFASGLTTPIGVASKISDLIASCGTLTLGTESAQAYRYLPDIGTHGGTPQIAAAGALAVDRFYTNALTATTAFTMPDPAATPKGSVITMVYIGNIGNTNEHTFTVHSNDTTFAIGSTLRAPAHAARAGRVDVAVAADNIITITGATNGDGGVGTTLRFVNSTGAQNGWMVDAVIENQGNGSTASTVAFS